MSNEKKDILDAIGGNATNGGNGGEPDYKALYEQTQRELQANKVEAGRLRKTNEELSSMRKELEELKRSRRTEDAISALPDDLKDEVPDEIKRGTAIIANQAVDTAIGGAIAATNERLARLEAEQSEERNRTALMRKAEFERRIADTYPDFVNGIGAGGDKHDAWVRYQRHNMATIQSAVAACDFATLEYHIRNFYRDIGVDLPAGGGEAVADPRATTGGTSQFVPHETGKTYTLDEYIALQEKCERLFYTDKAEYRKLRDELEKAMAENRVKRQ